MDPPLDLGARGGDGDRGQMFTAHPLGLERLGADSTQPQRIAGIAAANLVALAAFQNGDVVRWDQCEDQATKISFGNFRCNDIGRVLLEPKGFHALITNNAGDSWYLNFESNEAKPLPKLKGFQIEAVAWDPDSTPASTRDLLLGTEQGQLLHVVIEGKEKVVKTLFAFELGAASGAGAGGAGLRRVPICGVHRERAAAAADGSERTVVFVAAGCGIYAFVGPTLEAIFQSQRYQGEGAAARALVYEVPRDSSRGELHVDAACVGPAFAKALFWLTGVGVLTAMVKTSIEADGAVLECPPGIIPFPPSPKATAASRMGGSLISSLLPPPPPPAPGSMALTKYHVVLLFDDRWAVVSRITHELVQQQEWARATHGAPRNLVRDLHGERLWMCSDKQIFEISAEGEDRNVWALLLRLDRFQDALEACRSAGQRARVLLAQADWLFRKGRYLEAARKFAEAPSVPFEHVALRFLRLDHKAALLEYLRCRLKRCPVEDKVTRALLGVWAVEISLAHLNELRAAAQGPKGRAALDAERARLHELLKDCKDLDVHEPVYHLLQSHGWLDELAFFAEARRDFHTVIVHHVSRRDCAGAIRKLADFQAAGAGEDLVCRFAPVLFGAEPRAFVSLLMRPQLEKVDPLSVLPAVYLPRAPATHRAEAIRYLRHVVNHHPGFRRAAEGAEDAGPALARGGTLRLDSDLMGGAGEDGPAGAASGGGRGCWASGTGLLSALTALYACDCVAAREAESASRSSSSTAAPPGGGAAVGVTAAEAEERLLAFLSEQEKNPLLGPHFALRVCHEKGIPRAVVLLYGAMGMFEEAVDVALQHGDVGLAKQNASRPEDPRLRRKLWLRIVEHQVASGDVQRITSLIGESQELSVRDVLPYMPDSMTIDVFQVEICRCLDTYESQIESLRQEMDDHRRALQAFKEDLKQAQERCIVVEPDQACEICGAPAMKERFYVFACRHCFHEACLRALVLPVLGPERHERLFALEALRLEHQAAAAGALSGPPSTALAEVEDELDGILADDCPLCGHLMIQTITRPFIDPDEDAEVESWAIT